MLTLQNHHIIDLYVFVDDNLEKMCKHQVGRPALLSDSELITALIWNIFTVRQKLLKDIHKWLLMYHKKDFPKISNYSAFVDHCHRVTPLMVTLLQKLLQTDSPIAFLDSTMVPVCKLVRADSHKVAKDIAKFGKNHQGWHYGFKLHASVNLERQLCGLALTPANIHDAQKIPALVNRHTKIAVGDGAYTASVMRNFIWKKTGTIIVSPPHPKQKLKVINWWQLKLLTMRPKIETVFDYLKEHLNLVSSFPRSIKGYLVHYIRILLSYQILALF